MGMATSLPVIDPATGTLLREHPTLDTAEVQRRIEAAHRAFLDWRRVPFPQRSEVLDRAAAQLLAGKDRYAARITAEMGKPIRQARAEIDKCAWVCRYYAEQGENLLSEERIPLDDAEARLPRGRDLCDHALEFSFLAGLSRGRSGPDGR